MKTLYLECYSGISGDMTVAALLDLGASEKALRKGLESLNLGGYSVEITTTNKRGIRALDFNVVLDKVDLSLFGKKHGHEHNPAHDIVIEEDPAQIGRNAEKTVKFQKFGQEYNFAHDYDYSLLGEEVSEIYIRGIDDINKIIDDSGVSCGTKNLAKKIFSIVAQAEAKVHGIPVEDVHFHEVGAIDSIVDVLGAAILIDDLQIDRVIATPVREGRGTVKCRHGIIPVPAPATLEIARSHGIPLVITDNEGEMVTPTGAAIIAAICESYDAPGKHRIIKTGYGAGKKDFAAANALRASIIEEDKQASQNGGEFDEVVELSCNIDDMTAEQLAYACDVFMENGALDCWTVPAVMKKSRPAYVLNILIPCDKKDFFAKLVFMHTTSIGVRYSQRSRIKMKRSIQEISTKYGKLSIKACEYEDVCKSYVEYESAKTLAKLNDIPIFEIYRQAEIKFEKLK